MIRLHFIFILSLFSLTSCIPLLISKAIKEEKQIAQNSVEILAAKKLTHQFVEGSQRQESMISNRNKDELVFFQQRTIYQHNGVYRVHPVNENSSRITYFDVVFIAQQKRMEVNRHSVWQIIQLLEQNQILEIDGLNEEAINRIVIKYGGNSFSSLNSNRPPVIIRNGGGNR